MNYAEESLRLHGEWQGKIEVVSRVKVENKEDLSLAYTPGVAQPCLEIQKDYASYSTNIKSSTSCTNWKLASFVKKTSFRSSMTDIIEYTHFLTFLLTFIL